MCYLIYHTQPNISSRQLDVESTAGSRPSCSGVAFVIAARVTSLYQAHYASLVHFTLWKFSGRTAVHPKGLLFI